MARRHLSRFQSADRESTFQSKLVQDAKKLGWISYHTYDSRRSDEGFPDLVLVRERVIYAELKSENGVLSQDQRKWFAALQRAKQEVYVWYPSDYEYILKILARRHYEPVRS